ncbi:hypothetical protein GCM10012287_50060 [Streptomyces daqingensis]|uniref:Uncharacterized protein n=1 Tax=Streptomyces daqingensis TaxID=1472640 RepID=A0ABQ2MQY7_9ACTN|nr:hypothetical protein GCM10012287_50060 [Streptomyces daqingensis]
MPRDKALNFLNSALGAGKPGQEPVTPETATIRGRQGTSVCN